MIPLKGLILALILLIILPAITHPSSHTRIDNTGLGEGMRPSDSLPIYFNDPSDIEDLGGEGGGTYCWGLLSSGGWCASGWRGLALDSRSGGGGCSVAFKPLCFQKAQHCYTYETWRRSWRCCKPQPDRPIPTGCTRAH